MARALRTLDPTLVRRLAVSRQRLTGPLPAAPGPGEIVSVTADLGSLQLDPISVVARSHLLVLWSRLGGYDQADVDDLLWQERRLFEYWTHAAAIVCMDDLPIHSLLMRRYPSERHRQLREWLARQPGPAPLDPAPAADERSPADHCLRGPGGDRLAVVGLDGRP
jgi:uncharacterized protein YcaQ